MAQLVIFSVLMTLSSISVFAGNERLSKLYLIGREVSHCGNDKVWCPPLFVRSTYPPHVQPQSSEVERGVENKAVFDNYNQDWIDGLELSSHSVKIFPAKAADVYVLDQGPIEIGLHRGPPWARKGVSPTLDERVHCTPRIKITALFGYIGKVRCDDFRENIDVRSRRVAGIGHNESCINPEAIDVIGYSSRNNVYVDPWSLRCNERIAVEPVSLFGGLDRGLHVARLSGGTDAQQFQLPLASIPQPIGGEPKSNGGYGQDDREPSDNGLVVVVTLDPLESTLETKKRSSKEGGAVMMFIVIGGLLTVLWFYQNRAGLPSLVRWTPPYLVLSTSRGVPSMEHNNVHFCTFLPERFTAPSA